MSCCADLLNPSRSRSPPSISLKLRLSMASMPSKARLDYESSLPKHLLESFVFRDAQMTV